MNTSVYYHHVTRISEAMCSRAVEYMIENKELDPLRLRQMDDIDLVAAMRNATGPDMQGNFRGGWMPVNSISGHYTWDWKM